MPVRFATSVVILLLATATMTDLRRGQVPAWLTLGGSGAGLLVVTAAAGWETLQPGLLGLGVGGLLLLSFVLTGGFGEGDALLLVTVGTCLGWQFVFWVASWTALIGACLAIVAWPRGQRTFPYVPAMALGAALALLSA